MITVSAIPGQSFFPYHATQVTITHAPPPHRLGSIVTLEHMHFSCGPRTWPHRPCSVQRLVTWEFQFLGLTDTPAPRRPKGLESSSPPPGIDRPHPTPPPTAARTFLGPPPPRQGSPAAPLSCDKGCRKEHTLATSESPSTRGLRKTEVEGGSA